VFCQKSGVVDYLFCFIFLNYHEAERRQFFEKYIKTFQSSMDADGNLEIRLKK